MTEAGLRGWGAPLTANGVQSRGGSQIMRKPFELWHTLSAAAAEIGTNHDKLKPPPAPAGSGKGRNHLSVISLIFYSNFMRFQDFFPCGTYFCRFERFSREIACFLQQFCDKHCQLLGILQQNILMIHKICLVLTWKLSAGTVVYLHTPLPFQKLHIFSIF